MTSESSAGRAGRERRDLHARGCHGRFGRPDHDGPGPAQARAPSRGSLSGTAQCCGTDAVRNPEGHAARIDPVTGTRTSRVSDE